MFLFSFRFTSIYAWCVVCVARVTVSDTMSVIPCFSCITWITWISCISCITAQFTSFQGQGPALGPVQSGFSNTFFQESFSGVSAPAQQSFSPPVSHR